MNNDCIDIFASTFEKVLENEYWMIAVKSNKGKNRYVILQLAYEFDEQDIEAGMDTYYLEVCDQSNSKYGGISNVSRSENAIIVNLDCDMKKLTQFECVCIRFSRLEVAEEFFLFLNKMISGCGPNEILPSEQGT